MELKVCCRCHYALPVQDFALRSKILNSRASMCKQCHRDYTKEHYGANKKYYRNKNKQKTKRHEELLRQLKSNPCVDCGGVFPWYCMDFDHRDSASKKAPVSRLRSTSKRLLLEEVAKCDLVCAICHRKRTWDRAHGGMADTPVLEAGALA